MTRHMKIAGLVALYLATLISFAPVVALIISMAVANMMDCPLDEGSVHPCLIKGVDFGDALYTGMILGWGMLITWPGMLLATLVWLFLAIRFLLRHFGARA